LPAVSPAFQPTLSTATVSMGTPVRPDEGAFGNTHCRFNIAFAAFVLVFSAIPLWLPPLAPNASGWVTAAIFAAIGLAWLLIAACAIFNFRQLMRMPVMRPDALPAARGRRFRHIVMIPCYKDPVELLFDCLCSLLAQENPSHLVVVIAFEARTPELEQKQAAVRAHFEGRFGRLICNVHTLDPSREIPGKCSNTNSALRAAHQILFSDGKGEAYAHTVTTCDTDSLFHPSYFSVLEACYNEENPRLGQSPAMLVWQPALFYNWHLHRRPVFTRVTGVVRAMLMLGGLIPFGLNPMSIFSYPLELGASTGFINPRYSVEDIIFQVRAICQTSAAVPLRLLPVPVISGPTIGSSYAEDFYEWQLQLRRWAIGSAEAAHYFIIHWRGTPLLGGLRWFLCFTAYYAILLCSSAPFCIIASLPFPWATFPHVQVAQWQVSLQYAGLFALACQYAAFTAAFAMDRLAVRLLTVDDHVHPLRNLVHFALAPVVLIGYGLFAFYAVMRFVVRGKRDAGHVMAAKVGFAAANTNRLSEAVLQEHEAQKPVGELPLLRTSFSVRSSAHSAPLPVDGLGTALALVGDARLAYELPDLFRFGAFEFNPKPQPFMGSDV